MIDRVLIDTLDIKSRDFAIKWKEQVRSTPQLKHYHKEDDETLIEFGRLCFPVLSRILDRGLDHNIIGDFFVKLGKERMKEGFPISEVIYGLNMAQKVVNEFLMTEYAPDNSIKMYQAMSAITRISEFFFLGSFYLSKGFLEETYTSMSHKDKVSENVLKNYFKDDFFFK
jgi:hypothetical protein